MVRVRQEGTSILLEVEGELDLARAPELREAAEQAWAAAPGARNLVVDLRAVTFLDSSGLGVLFGRLREVRERGGRLALVVPRGAVRRVLERGGLLGLSLTVASPEEALRRV